MTAERKPTKAEVMARIGPIFQRIEQRLERERREAAAQPDSEAS